MAPDSGGKADRRAFSLRTGGLPVSPYECAEHLTELMKSCTNGIRLNKGFYSQGRFLYLGPHSRLYGPINQVPPQSQTNFGQTPGAEMLCPCCCVQRDLLVDHYGSPGNLRLGVIES